MTLSQLITTIWYKYDKSTDVPTSGSEDYTLITAFLNDAVEAWGNAAHEDNIRWRELFTTLTSASTGTKTTTASTASYVCPDDFVDISSFVEVDSVEYAYVKADDVMAVLATDSSKKVFWLTRNSTTGKWWINISPTPTESSLTIEYSYYKTPTQLTTGTSIIGMKKPYFAVYHVLAALLEDERPDLAQVYSQKAVALMNAMLIDNEIPPAGQSFKLRDIAYESTGDAFGK